MGQDPHHQRDYEDPATRNSWRFWPTIVVIGGFGLVAVLMMLVASLWPDHADRYIRVLEAMLSWPALAFALLLILILLFHQEFSSLINRVRKVSHGDTSIDLFVQPGVPRDERGLELPDDPRSITADHAQTHIESDMNSAIRFAYMKELKAQNEQLRAEAKRWWYRYLATFLTVPTHFVLRAIRNRPPQSVGSLLKELEEAERIEQGQMIKFDQIYDLHGVIPPMSRRVLMRSLEVLEQYDLIERYGGGRDEYFRIAPSGIDFLDFEESPEGQAFYDEVVEARELYEAYLQRIRVS